MKKYLITGAGGFLGTHLVEALLNRNNEDQVYCTDISKDGLIDRYASYSWFVKNQSRIIFSSTEEILDPDFVMNEIDCVVNCAFPRNVRGPGFASGLLYVEQVIKRVSVSKTTAFINISSQSVYDFNRKEPAKESDLLYLDTPYCVGKFMSEELCEICFEKGKYTNIRMASLIGPGFEQRVVNKMVKSALETNTISIIKNQQQFGFVDVEDAVNGIISIMNTAGILNWNKILNLGSTVTYSLDEIGYSIKNILESVYHYPNINVIVADQNDLYLNSSLDATSLYDLTGFKCTITLEKSIKKIIDSKI